MGSHQSKPDAQLYNPEKVNYPLHTGSNIKINVEDPNINFFFFGCWNKNLSATELIVRNIESKKFFFGIIIGDNFYPEKLIEPDGVSKKKIFNLENISKGFEILKIFKNPIYIGLGNHEVDNPKPCATLIEEINQSLGTNLMMPSNYYCLDITKKSKIFIIDTNLFEINECYNESVRSMAKKTMLEWLEKNIRENIKNNIIIIGHFPLYYINKKLKFTINETMIELYNILIKYPRIKFYYMCADVHNYQHIEHENIIEIISGTGGADLDNIPNIENEEYIIDDKKFKVLYSLKEYGYVDINITNSDEIIHKFKYIPLFFGGYYNKN